MYENYANTSPLEDWERELSGQVKTVIVRLRVTHLDGSTTVIDGVNPETFVWKHLFTESNGGWNHDAPLVLSVQSEIGNEPFYYVPNVKHWTTEAVVEWVIPE